MSAKYKDGDTIPTKVLVGRLKELVEVITKRPEDMKFEFSMRIPAERDRDADLVISEAARRLKSLEARLAEMKKAIAELEWKLEQ